jgi:hypothetical protein
LVLIDHFPFLWNSVDMMLISEPWSIKATTVSFFSPIFTGVSVVALAQ